MNYNYAREAMQKKENISSATLAVSERHNSFINDVDVVEQTVFHKRDINGRTLETRSSEMLVKIKVDEHRYTAFLLYSNLDNLTKEIKKEMGSILLYDLRVEVLQ